MLTPEQIESREFLVSVRGYDRDEVHAFLREAAEQVRALREQLEAAVADARAAEQLAAEAEGLAQRERARADKADAELAARPPVVTGDQGGMFAEIGQQTQRILEAAAEAADGIRQQAKREVEQEIRKARRQADKLIAEGERRREELERGTIELARKREEVTKSLRAVARGLEQSLRELTLSEPGAATVREALRDDAAAAHTAQVLEELHTETSVQPAEDVTPDAAVEHLHDASPQVKTPHVQTPEVETAPEAETPEAETPEVGTPQVETAAVEAAPDAESAPVDAPAEAPVEAPGVTPVPASAQEPAAEEAGEARAQALEPLHPKVVRKLKRGLQDLQNLAYERLRSGGVATEPATVLPPDEEFAPIVESVAEFLEQAYLAGGEAGARLAGLPAPALSPRAGLAKEFGAEVARQLNGPLSATLRMAAAGREGLPALTDRVAAVFGELKQSVAEELSGTHLVHAFEAGMHDAWAAGGIPARRWVLGREPRCPEARCRTNDQSGPLRLADAFPSGHAHPPVHAGCTCTTVPVGEGSA